MDSFGACSVIITNNNSSKRLEKAIRSVLDQSVPPIDIVVVDDFSSADAWTSSQECVESLGDPRIKLIRRGSSRGQINAIFDGLEVCRGDFISFLDPNDLYEPDFVETLLRAHLNPLRIAAVATCEMGRYNVAGGVLSRTFTGFRQKALADKKLEEMEAHQRKYGFSRFFNPWEVGWPWSSTSGLMIRKDAMRMIRPEGLADDFLHSVDVYCAHGAHMIGGTLFVDQLLSWKGVDDENSAHRPLSFSSRHARPESSLADDAENVKDAVLHALLRNGISKYLKVQQVGEVVTTQYSRDRLSVLCADSPAVSDLMMRFGANLDWSKDSAVDGI